jgi:plasmid stability protein
VSREPDAGMPASSCYTACMNRQLTIRGVSEEVGRRLESLSRTRGQSLNATVLEILESAVGVAERRKRLARYATWTAEDLEEFNKALAAQRIIDDPLWR